jgi:hypothetical protein
MSKEKQTTKSVKQVVNALYAGLLSILEYADKEHVSGALTFFEKRFYEEMNKTYAWYAVATVAVEAGNWGGDKRVKRRAKLLKLINICREELGKELMEVPEEGLRYGLRYGYGAVQTDGELMLGILTSIRNNMRKDLDNNSSDV